MGAVDFRRFPGPQALADSAAADCLQLLSKAGSGDQPLVLALSGGRIATAFCIALAKQLELRRWLLDRVHFFWSDERCVPPNDPESNFHLASEALLQPLQVAPSAIHRIKGELSAEVASAEAASELRRTAPRIIRQQPVADLVLLGMGEDGHVASLFPGEADEKLTDPAVFRSVRAVKPPPLRVTMGYPAIAVAEQVWVLASGAGKAAALQDSLRSGGRTPLARVIQMRSSLRIYSDIPLERGDLRAGTGGR